MGLLESVKGRAYLAKEYRASDFKVGFEIAIDLEPLSRRKIDYKVAVKGGKKYWKEIGRREFMHEQSPFFGKWHWGWYHTDEELTRQTRLGTYTNVNK